MHILQVLQCEEPGGRIIWHVLQNLILYLYPLMNWNFRGDLIITLFSWDCLSGCLGRIPGSVNIVIIQNKRVDIARINSNVINIALLSSFLYFKYNITHMTK